MKTIFSLLIALMIVLSVAAGCAKTEQKPENDEPVETTDPDVTEQPDQTEYESVDIRLGGLKGPTTMGLVGLLDDSENGLTANHYEFTLGGSADELTPKLLKGELDILAAPANLASILYNNSDGAVEVIGINALGVVYIVEKGGETVQSLTDLAGKTIYATGKGSTPEYALNYLLAQSGLELGTDVTVEWKNEPTEVVALMAEQDQAIAMLPQPYVTVASNQLEDLRIAVDLTKEWEALDNGSDFITAALIVRREFAEACPEAVAKFLEEYEASAKFVNENIADAAQLIEKYDIVKAVIAEKAIPYCNIVCITGEKMKTSLSGYLEILAAQNPKAVGGNLPDADFYWVNEK